jgi:hypothetical protein
MKAFVLILISLCSMKTMMAQDFVREEDKKTGKVLLRGKITFDNLLQETSCKWLETGAKSYQPNRNAVDELSKIAGDYRFVVFAGTWCGDTKDLLPKFYKVLVEAGIDMHAIEMYGVNRNKEALNIEATLYGIKNIPTIIVMHQFREIGRIVENVNTSIEEDLDAMIRKDYAILQKERAQKIR